MAIRRSKARRSAVHARKAVGLFTGAQKRLARAEQLAGQAESEHSNAAVRHAAHAASARQDKERHARVRGRLEELLS